MKFSVSLSILILVVAAVVGWSINRRLTDVTETHRSLLEKADKLGLTVGVDMADGAPLVTKRLRGNKDEQEALAFAGEFIAFAIEVEALQKTGEQPDETFQAKSAEFMDLMLSMDADQIGTIIEAFRADEEMSEQMRMGMISFAIMALADSNPAGALGLLIEKEELFDQEMMGAHVLSSSLAGWAREDPAQAIEWVRKNGGKYPDLITDEVKAGLIQGVGFKDLRLGFSMIGELELEDARDAISKLGGVAGTPGERSEFLSLYREYLKTAGDGQVGDALQGISAIGSKVVGDGFEEATRWIAENELSQAEIDRLSQDVRFHSAIDDKGRWIEWMGEELSPEVRDRRIESAMRDWTANDYREAGEWLAVAPDGPAKAASVAGYVQAVTPHDPQTAAQWALTLPPGKARTETLRTVYDNWPQDDTQSQAEREAFMAEHPVE